MRTTNLYQLYDIEAQAVAGPIMSEKADAVAIRSFHAVLAHKDTLPGQFPQHFQLCKLGSQDEETGVISRDVLIIATGHAWLLQQQQANNAQPPITPR